MWNPVLIDYPTSSGRVGHFNSPDDRQPDPRPLGPGIQFFEQAENRLTGLMRNTDRVGSAGGQASAVGGDPVLYRLILTSSVCGT